MANQAAATWMRLGASVAAIIGIWLSVACAMAADGLITIASSFGPEETADRLESEITARGMTVFAASTTRRVPRKSA